VTTNLPICDVPFAICYPRYAICASRYALRSFRIKPLFLFIIAVFSLLTLAACGGTAPAQGWSSVTLDNGLLYFGSTLPKVFALDSATGTVKWEYKGETDKPLQSVYGTPVVANGIVYFGAYDGVFYALDAASGVKKWAVDEGSPIVPTPLVAQGTVYFGTNDHKFYALDAATGAPKWTTPLVTDKKIWGDAAYDNGTIYFGSLDANLYAVDATTGTKKWAYPAGGLIAAKPLIANGVIYFGALNKLIALDAASGNLKWDKTFADSNEWIWAPVTTQNNTLYVGTTAGKVYAFDTNTGDSKWAQPFTAGGQIRSAIVIQDNIGYFGASDKNVYALDLATGQLKWNPVTLTGPVMASPLFDNGTLYVPTSGYNGQSGYNMYALNATDGTRKWCFDQSTAVACTQ